MNLHNFQNAVFKASEKAKISEKSMINIYILIHYSPFELMYYSFSTFLHSIQKFSRVSSI